MDGSGRSPARHGKPIAPTSSALGTETCFESGWMPGARVFGLSLSDRAAAETRTPAVGLRHDTERRVHERRSDERVPSDRRRSQRRKARIRGLLFSAFAIAVPPRMSP